MLRRIKKILFGILLAALALIFAVTERFMACINLSVCLFLCPFLILIGEWVGRLCQKGLSTQPRRSIGSTALMYTVCFMAAACLLRYATNGYVLQVAASLPEAGETVPPSIGVQLVDALLLAIRSIGISENYLEWIDALKQTWSALYPQATVGQTVMVVYTSLLIIAIPVAGSTMVLGMFAQVFPRFMLWLKYRNPFRLEKCYFSGLNPQSVALAKSILEARKAEGKWILPLLIFTDAYVDDESEQSNELLLEAKRLGAICLRDDLTHVLKTSYGDRKYFLMEEEEFSNLPALMGLVEMQNAPYLKNATIYLFVQTDSHLRLEKKIRALLTDVNTRGKKALTEEELPAVIPVNAHRNLVNNLMEEVPLYEPLVEKEKSELHITIFGNGSIGTEAFLSAYWFGRLAFCRPNKFGEEELEECAVTIHVVSQDDEDTFWAKMDSINPDIRGTTRQDDPLLEWRPGRFNRPYCTVKYHKADVKAGVFGGAEWLDVDYAIVALGNDADNVAVANKLRAYIGKAHLEGQTEAQNTVIAYVVYNSDLCRALNTETQSEYGVYMYAFGALDEVYGHENVFMTKNQLLALDAYKAYHGSGAGKPTRTYDQMASLARAMHVKYKLFSLGWITTSLFITAKEEHEAAVRAAREQYHRVTVVGKLFVPDLYAESVTPPVREGETDPIADLLNEADYDKWLDLYRKRHTLAWLEHRRWAAYTRTMGFRSTDAMERYYLAENGHKNMSLKLHPCLVEARLPAEGTKRTYVYTDEVFWKSDAADARLWEIDPDADALDIHHILRWRAMAATWDVLLGMPLEADKDAPKEVEDAIAARCQQVVNLQGSMGNRNHCKKFDYFIGEHSAYVKGSAFCREMGAHLDLSPDRWEKWCEKWAQDFGAFRCANGEWLIPADCLEGFVGENYPLKLSVKDYAVAYGADDERVPAPFAFAYNGAYYARATAANKRRVRAMETACEEAARAAVARQARALSLAAAAAKERGKAN